MGSYDLLGDVWEVLAADAEFLAFRDLTPDSTTKRGFIEKGEQTAENVKPNGADESGEPVINMPKVLLYERPGSFVPGSTQFYTAKVVLSCYANDVKTAQQMADRAWEVLKGFRSGSAFSCQLAYRTSFATGIPGIAGYRIFFDFNTYTG